jgi:16S rRNA (cytosine1402-N4)-methyltransferase
MLMAPASRPTHERHIPVLLDRIVFLLAPALERPDAVFIDTTLGMGGHSEALLRAFPTARLIGIDRDPQALALAGTRLAPFGDRVDLVHGVYDEIASILVSRRLTGVDAVLMDLGVSSLQLDETERGFAYAHDAALDMRMNPDDGLTAADILNTYDLNALTRILREYGEEKFARRIAERIVRERELEPFTTSARLVELVRECIPAAARRTGGNPAKRTFQALRIEVNSELVVLERAVPAAIDALNLGGRIAVLAYHSLEDRIVKHALVARATSKTPPGLPVLRAEDEPELRLVTRGAEQADAAELAVNPRAGSARLRVAERVRVLP